MLNDLRYALRTLKRNPGFALTAIVSIGIGVGANATIFSMTDGLLLRPLPVPNPSQVVTVLSRTPSGTFDALSYADFSDFREKNRSFDGLFAYQLASFGFATNAKAQPHMTVGFLTTGNLFQVLHTEPHQGRGFRPEEDQVPGRNAVLVLGHDFWKTEFASDPGVIGRRVLLNGVEFEVIGVAPESFTGLDQFVRPSFFVPAMMASNLVSSNSDLLTNRARRSFSVKGRLKPGVSIASADAEAAALAKSLELGHPESNRAFGACVRTEIQARQDFSPGNSILIGFLFPIVMVALGIACANVANLVLSRGQARAREIAVRLAIGASRMRLVRQLMMESLLIALTGGALGLLLANVGVEFLSTIQIPSDIPIDLSFKLDLRVLLFALLVSVVSALLFGLVPALQSTKTDLVPALKAGDLDNARKRFFGRNTLVVAQVAGSVVLLVVATQLYRGFAFAISHNPGFRTSHILMMSFDPTLVRYTPAQTEQFFRTLIDRSRQVPGVKSAALSLSIPMGTNMQSQTVMPEGYQFPVGKENDKVLANTVDEGYFETFGVPLLRGRGFTRNDRADSTPVAVVNDKFARHYLGENPVGKRLRLTQNGPWVEVVGVAANGKYFSIVDPPIDFFYLPLSQHPQSRMTLLVESYGDPAALATPLQEVARSIDSNLPVFGIRTMTDFFDQRAVKVVHLVNGIVDSVGFMGFGLALVGLYAVVSYQVARRTREIGIRMAIGAGQPQVMRMILKQSAVMSVTGVVLGLAVSFAGGRAMSAGLGVPAFDPVLFGLVPIGLLLTTLLASAIPARRASRVDPMQALRQD